VLSYAFKRKVTGPEIQGYAKTPECSSLQAKFHWHYVSLYSFTLTNTLFLEYSVSTYTLPRVRVACYKVTGSKSHDEIRRHRAKRTRCVRGLSLQESLITKSLSLGPSYDVGFCRLSFTSVCGNRLPDLLFLVSLDAIECLRLCIFCLISNPRRRYHPRTYIYLLLTLEYSRTGPTGQVYPVRQSLAPLD
jgi:hypothetical protein